MNTEKTGPVAEVENLTVKFGRTIAVDQASFVVEQGEVYALFDELIGELAERGTTVLLTTHDLTGIEGVATRVGVIREGRMVIDEDLEVLKAGFRRVRFPRAEDGEVPRVPGILCSSSTSGLVEVIVSNFDDAAEMAFREVAGDRMEISGLSLEEIFIAVSSGSDGGVS